MHRHSSPWFLRSLRHRLPAALVPRVVGALNFAKVLTERRFGVEPERVRAGQKRMIPVTWMVSPGEAGALQKARRRSKGARVLHFRDTRRTRSKNVFHIHDSHLGFGVRVIDEIRERLPARMANACAQSVGIVYGLEYA